MADTIRSLYIGREAVEGTAAATVLSWPFIDFKPTDKQARHAVKEYQGSRGKHRVNVAGKAYSEMSLKTHGYFDLMGWLLCSALNAPTTTGHSGSTGVKDHSFKIGSSVPTLTLQWYDGIQWYQALGVSVADATFAFDNDKPMECDWKLIGRTITTIGAPTPVSIALAAYVQPMGATQQAVSVNGSTYASLVTGKFSLKNNRAPFHTIRTNADMLRATEGDVELDFDLAAEFTALSGSLYSSFRANTSIGAVVITIVDAATVIGTGTPANPTFSITVPAPLVTSGDLDPMKVNTWQMIKGQGGLSSATVGTFLLTNEVTAYTAS